MLKHSFPTPLPEWIAYSPVASGASFIYKTITGIRNKWYNIPGTSKKVTRPVISIGGIRAGGTGKTPSAILVGNQIISMGYNVAFLSRGYHRKTRKLQVVSPNETLNWELIGDEPAMIHKAIPESWLGIHSRRVLAARALEEKLPSNSIFILDDGFQHRQIARDLDIVCLHENTFEEILIPQGFLREPFSSLSRADAAFLICDSEKTDYFKQIISEQFPKLQLFELIYEPICYINANTGISSVTPPSLTPVALCGIARPERFFQTLHKNGIHPCKEVIFPDHHRYTEYDVSSIQKLYLQGLITTEKDAIRLLSDKIIPDKNFWYLKMNLSFKNADLYRFNMFLSTIF